MIFLRLSLFLFCQSSEKWDVLTRKSGDGSIMKLVKLLIIDEVHLLGEERGPVIEVLVARTLRLVESSQQMCRIIGLSATLPNYQDVAVFLGVNLQTGCFYFDSSYRPVPLSQTFIAVNEHNQQKNKTLQNEIAFKKTIEVLKNGHQVMIFVHSRRETAVTARMIREMARVEGKTPLFDCKESKDFFTYESRMMRSKNSDLRELFTSGIAIHNAGMVRNDRSLVEAAFTAGAIKVLVCTATLAWGVSHNQSSILRNVYSRF